MLNYNYRTILSVALPLMVSSFIQSIVMISDAAFLSRYNTIAFDACGNASLIYVTIFMALTGLSDGVQILIARRIGQDKHHAIGRIFGTSVVTIGIVSVLLFSFLIFIIPQLLPLYTRHLDLTNLQIEFLSVRSYALLFCMFSLPIQAFFLATGKTWVVLVSALIIAISNIILGYLLIFGYKDFIPSLGIKGAALASTIAELLGMLFLVIFLIFSQERKLYKMFHHFAFQWKSFLELIKIGSPLFFQGFIALAAWTVFFTWIEQMGKFELTVSQNIRSFYFLAFVPILGFAATTKTYVSQYIGKADFESLKTIQRRIQLLTILFLFIFFHGALLYPKIMITLINPEEIYVAKSAEILRYIAGSFLIFGLISVKFQTVNGSGNTIASFLIELFSISIYLLFSYLLIKVWKAEIFWVWSVEYIYFGALGILSIGYLKLFNWKIKKI
jgi:MATE family multidrug resistance protein